MRIAHPSAGEPPSLPCPMAADDNRIYEALLRRCQNLEASHTALTQKLRGLEKRQPEPPNDSDDELYDDDDDDGESSFLRSYSLRRPYKTLLESLGHALQVFKASSGEIIYWNRSAENLYGWRDYEVVGRRSFTELLVPEEHYIPLQKIMGELLRTGEPWSGQFPYKNRAGKVFMALVTKSLLYEDGEFAGVIVVASDAEMVNGVRLNNSQRRDRGLNFNKIKWKPRPPIAPAPEIATSVSNLAAKVLAKLQIKGGANNANDDDGSNRKRESSCDSSPQATNAWRTEATGDSSRKLTTDDVGNASFKREPGHSGKHDSELPSATEDGEVNVHSGKSGSLRNSLGNAKGTDNDEEQRWGKQFPGSEGSSGRRENPPSEADIESNSLVDCEIQWADLHMGEEIGQGFYAIVYRGIWNGSDVAIKVYVKNEYSEGTLQDYKKEIDIMKRLRHPNVLLFMGAAYSKERLAIITEFMPRGSLFKTLHKNNQVLDIRRRLRMALDVARGMNYLHRRHPPIVHRDLKSSNLLVDKNWTVKVGDFGLSKLKNTTFLTAKSGRGTPQWMAPEVLRNEPSNEKSDVYSFGVVLWELITESIPWNNLNALQVVGIVGFMDRRLDLPEGIEPQIASIIRDCWKSDPAQRPSFEDIIRSMSKLNPRLVPVTSQKSAEF